jgi:signal transduction histidine kinase
VGADGAVEHLVCAGLDVTERRRQEEELRVLHRELEVRLEELRASRARILEAEDAARRRIERNLHDGAQQRLVSVSMALGLAESRLALEPQRARSVLHEARESLSTALEELREISQGIHPAILTERGLATAIRELAYRAPMTNDLDVAEDRLPELVEAAAYYVVAESLANIGKHASASRVHVTVARANGTARVLIADDGVGGADPVNGSGLRGLTDRVEALGGTFSVDSPPGRGTRIEVEIPCES